ncbi:metal ABC transporter permease [Acaricomes phytoseiuli]|uniref:metal ABC transporter permease n=1 Tax=Acaricomes phytoseiuli TaxID=291968 RepID=UPI002223389C|nr:metal ABC transporter permease [Acaricomes phytoseiuli]MCW1249371.1 metal ABC transporter permease [Acaricomes phytoseiuli]
MTWEQIFGAFIDFSDYGELVPLFRDSLLAGAVLGLLGGLIGIFVMMRDLAFAVHGIAELSFAGAALALLLGFDVITGSLIGSITAAGVIGLLGVRARDRNSIIGVLMPFGLGLGILFISLYPGRSANKFGMLTGQIVAVDSAQLGVLAMTALIVIVALAVIWRPLTFASADAEIAEARGVPVRALSLLFMLLLGISVALSLQIVGALLVLALLITPAAAAMQLTATPRLVVLLSVLFALTAVVGGILLALGSTLPVSPYVTTLSFMIYVICRLIAWKRKHSARGAGGTQSRSPAGSAASG